MTRKVFERPSNPWSAWTRLLSVPLVFVAFWTRSPTYALLVGGRVVLRDLERALTDEEANGLRDDVYAAVHEGTAWQWASGTGPPRSSSGTGPSSLPS